MLGNRIRIADDLLSRLKGLMFRFHLEEGEGLFITNTPSIHMNFVFFAIDAVFVDHDMKVTKIVRALPSWIGLSFAGSTGAKHVLELPANLPEVDDLRVGDQLVFTPNEDKLQRRLKGN
jgi:uncharacterized membrane protein (UPF0127 family)